MGMTMTQKILAAHAGLESVEAGQLIEADIDLALANDITGPVSIRELEKAGMDRVFDHEKVALVLDHFAPNKDIKSAEQCKVCREFAKKHDIVHFFDVGSMGIEHALLPEQGIVAEETSSSEPIAIHARTEHWAHSPRAWDRPTAQQASPRAKRGFACPPPSASS